MKIAPTSICSALRSQQGVTLLELMISLSVLGILLAVGVPSYTSITRENLVAAQSSTLMQTFVLARSEALKRGLRVSVCPIANDDTTVCLMANNWPTGWMVFEDDFGGAGTVDPGDRALQVFTPAPGLTITTLNSAVVYLPTAAVQTAVSFDVSKTGCTGTQKRRIAVATTGRTSLAHVAC
jgi:type IV fimbrial biogenesis protein FimT